MDGRRRGRAATAPIRVPRAGKIRDRFLLRQGYGLLRAQPLWLESLQRLRRRLERVVTSHAAVVWHEEERRRFLG